MVNTFNFYRKMKEVDINFFTGVPDSLLKQLCACISDLSENNHIIAANEGNAIALASGYHLATKKLPLVYMQNSGLGNTVNPLVSLTSDTVYSIPMLLVIGWRGQPGVKDEPQHLNQGTITPNLLDTMNIEYEILSFNDQEAMKQLVELSEKALEQNKPKALLIRKNTFSEYEYLNNTKFNSDMKREDALELILNNIKEDSYVFSTTGKASREVFELRDANNQSHNRDFLTVGSMGHTSSIALGFSLYNSNDVVCIDGDGALLMHMGSLAINATYSKNNLKYILINNFSHESVGGQKTIADKVDFKKIFEAVGFEKYKSVSTIVELKEVLKSDDFKNKKFALEVLVKLGSRVDLGRPTITPIQGKQNIMGTIK